MLPAISRNLLYQSITSVIIGHAPSLSHQYGPMTSKGTSTAWTSGTNGILSTRNLFTLPSPYVTDAVIPVINYTSSVMQSVATVNQAKSALKSNMKRVSAERALFARYLIHMVGDIHQPLHSVSLYNKTFLHGDAGGNLLKIKLLNGSM